MGQPSHRGVILGNFETHRTGHDCNENRSTVRVAGSLLSSHAMLMYESTRPIIGKKSVSFSAPPTTPSSSATKPRSSPLSCATKHCIEDICTAIHISSGTVRCLGMLPDDGKALHQHEVFLVENPKIKIARRSLQGLLEHPKQRVPGKGLSWRDSLNIAVTLTSCVIQLDGTGWLKRQWDSEDIVFLTHEYTNPYLCWDIPSANIDPGTDVESSHPIRDKYAVRCLHRSGSLSSSK